MKSTLSVGAPISRLLAVTLVACWFGSGTPVKAQERLLAARTETETAPRGASDPAPARASEPVRGGAGASSASPLPAEVVDVLQQQSDLLARLMAELKAQREIIAEQERRIRQLDEFAYSAVPGAVPVLPAPGIAAAPPVPSPLTIHVGDADLLLGGFMDATAMTRSTNHGSGIATSFGTIPFANTPQGGLSETRLSAQSSRITLQATSKVGRANLKGVIEADFLGAGPATLNVTSNANTLRMRIYWLQATRGKFEFLGGQSWSLLTPNRSGVSPVPGDLFFGQNVDSNYQMGLVWARSTQFRFVAHATDTVTAAVSLENPQQYVGSAVVLPAAFPAAEVDATGNTGAPNSYPDVIGKVAVDPKIGGRHQHLDAAVVVRGFKTYNMGMDEAFAKTGVGTAVNAVIEPFTNIRVVANSFFSSGGGRYIANTNGPDFVVNADHSLTLVGARSFLVGPEIQAGAKTAIFGYYSAAQFDQQVTADLNGRPIGFGVAGSTAANRSVNETTLGVARTFFRDPRIGGVQLMLQYSTVRRTPFSVPVGTPADASLRMFYVNVRYLLP